jgi:hypothetical protein
MDARREALLSGNSAQESRHLRFLGVTQSRADLVLVLAR